MHLRVGPEGDKDEGADSGPVSLHAVAPDEHTLYTELSRPMPDYALEHVFAQHGPIEWVRAAPVSAHSRTPAVTVAGLIACKLASFRHC